MILFISDDMLSDFFKEVPVVEKQITLEFFSNSDQNSGKERIELKAPKYPFEIF
jgi:hypothetical protein